jgi:hypothetical protein
MSEIFLKLRIKEMLQGKMKRYLIFGVVEIFLVVAGILIALSVNNWATKKSQRNDEVKIYETILNRIQEDKHVIQSSIEYNKLYMDQFIFADRIIAANNRSELDTLVQIVSNLFRYSDTDKSSNIYQNLVNSGELIILENKEITSMLQNLEETYFYMNRMENLHQQAILDHFSQEIMNNIDLSINKAVHPEVLYSYLFRNMFYSAMELMDEKNLVYQRALRQIDSIVGMIEEEFEK